MTQVIPHDALLLMEPCRAGPRHSQYRGAGRGRRDAGGGRRLEGLGVKEHHDDDEEEEDEHEEEDHHDD